MSCDVGEATDGLENEMWRRWSDGKVGELAQRSSFSNLSVTSPTSQLILQPFRRFTYVTAHSPAIPLFHLRHSSFSNPYFASPVSQALHLRHLASLKCFDIICLEPVLILKLCKEYLEFKTMMVSEYELRNCGTSKWINKRLKYVIFVAELKFCAVFWHGRLSSWRSEVSMT